MDYDDNDNQCHNILLAGQEGPKTSPLLKPYAFPKFDFDDSLPGHLRLDSIVESEVFLGIQSQEDNQWIEDFSRANNGIEFSSCATDSCSISRRNNVWSEAASSESVEMLLKSVGQEEVVAEESLAVESNDCDELGFLTKQMECNDKPDNGQNELVADPIFSSTQVELLETSPGLEAGMEFSEFKNASQFQESVATVKENIFVSAEYKDNSGRVATFSANDSEIPAYKPAEEDSYGCVSLVDHLTHSAELLSASKSLSTAETEKQVGEFCLESDADLSEDITCDKKHSTYCKEDQIEVLIFEEHISDSSGHIVGNSHQLVSDSVAKGQGAAFESNPDNVVEAAGGEAKSEARLQDMQINDGDVCCSNSEQLGIGDDENFQAARVMCNPFRGIHEGGSPDDELEQHASQFISGNAGHSVSCAMGIDSITQIDQRQDYTPSDDLSESSHATNADVSANTPQPSLFSSEESEPSICMTGNISNSSGFESSELAVLSSPLMLNNGGKVQESLEACHSEIEVCDDGHSPRSVDISLGQVNEVKSVTRNSDAGESNGAFASKKNEVCCGESPPDLKYMDHGDVETPNFDQKPGSLVARGSTADATAVVHGLHSPTAMKLEPEKDVSSSGKNLNPAISNSIAESEQPSGTRPSHVDEGQEAAREMSTEVSFSSLKAFASGETAVEDAAEAEASMAVEDVEALLPCSAEKLSPAKTYDKTSRSEPFPLVTSHFSEHNLKESDAGPSHEAVYKGVDSGATYAAIHDDLLLNTESEKSSGQPADQKASCDSPTVISSQELSQKDQGNLEEGVRVQSVSEDPGRKDIPSDDSSFTFKVISLPTISEKENGSNWSPVPSNEVGNSSTVVEGSTPGAAVVITIPGGSRKISDTSRKPPRSASERKTRRESGKGASKESKINQADTTPEKFVVKGDAFCDLPLHPFGGSVHAKFGGMQSYGHIELNNTKFPAPIAIPTSNVPNLNSSALNPSAIPAAAFYQPFTDMQQVQLRAQIFVYGSLIQGTAPDEPFMAAAFGPSDGGKSVWESVWLAAVKRVGSKICQSSGAETPLQSHSRIHDVAAKDVSQQSRLLASPVSRATSKASPGRTINPTIPPASPLWTMSTPARDIVYPSGSQRDPIMDFQQVSSPLQHYQTPTMRNLAGPAPWTSPGPFAATWISAAMMPTSDVNACLAPSSVIETVQLTPASNPYSASSPGGKLVTSSAPAPFVAPATLFSEVSPVSEMMKGTISAEQYSADAKPKKRKRVPGSDDLSNISVLSETPTKQVVTSSDMTPTNSKVVLSEIQGEPAAAAYAVPLGHSLVTVTSAFPVPKTDAPSGKFMHTTCSEETLSKVAEAKLQAERAASLAADAVSHTQSVWAQLAKQKESGLTSEVEAKLASAAVAIAAAASVAAAAAAAAEIASGAALQAKLMADEALDSVSSGAGISFMEQSYIGKATPPVLQANGGSTELSASILVVAKEAAKRRLEAASAASKQAENLHAIIKASELAAEAVSQAGKIVAMGDPLPLSELIRAGPVQYWKLPSTFPELTSNLKNKNGGEATAENGEDASIKLCGDDYRSVKPVTQGKATSPRPNTNDEGSEPSIPVPKQAVDELNCYKSIQVDKSVEVLPLETGSEDGAFQSQDVERMLMSCPNTVKEGCMVEVLKDGDAFKPGWFAATVLVVEDGKAFVSYEDLLTEDGSESLKEWVSLEVDDSTVPKIRLPYPWSSLHLQGAKKRRRADMVDYAWAVGDKVDAFINHCWCEGVLTEKNEKDETAFTVHFPARSETAVVRAWQLRPSRIWSDGKWIEWPSSGKLKQWHLGDTPKGKRRKVQTQKGTDELSDGTNQDSKNPEESNPLALATTGKAFNVGRGSTEENKHAHRTLRTGLQKEGSTVYGLPKNGKKQKFMEVSKHFPANRNHKSNEVDNATKSSKHLVPKETTSRGWRNASKLDPKEKLAANSKLRAPVTRGLHGNSVQATPRGDNLVNPALTDDRTNTEDFIGHDDVSGKSVVVELCSSSTTEGGAEGPLSSSVADKLDKPSKKVASSSSKSEQPTKRKAPPSGGRLAKIDEERVYDGNIAKSVGMAEPRRSNRRIQPTHRLLEGLQSSMMIPKMPPISHDKGPRSHSRSSSSRGK